MMLIFSEEINGAFFTRSKYGLALPRFENAGNQPPSQKSRTAFTFRKWTQLIKIFSFDNHIITIQHSKLYNNRL